MRNYSLITILVAFVFLTACTKEREPNQGIKFSVTTDSSVLNARISHPNVPITLKQLKSPSSAGFLLVGEAESPQINGERLSASSVIFANNKAYVTYHMRGQPFGGGIVVYNLSNPAQPTINSQILFDDIDINISAFKSNGSSIYLGGSSATQGGVVIPVNVSGQGGINTSQNLQITKIGNAPSVNGIVHVGNRLIVSAGNTSGGFWAINQGSLQVLDQQTNTGAKSVAFNEGSGNSQWFMGLVAGSPQQNAVLKVFNGGVNPGFSGGWQFDLGQPAYHQAVEPDYDQWGKLHVFIKPSTDICYVPLGVNGMKAIKVNPSTSTIPQVVYTSPANMLTIGNTNSVSADNDYIYLANGADGVLFAKPPQSGNELDVFGIWDNSQYPGSANFVASNNTHVFVAKGKEGGLKILLKVN